ncbi:DUF4446 family protein [Parasporobacterium paucivorans]|uniref:DUF4446 domain-containing protein n=1 Tax=Parasporobacterium paucivorans DSM 15970 TaxID=1122934 RepID=A0A1M6B8Z3_9FIRM|nr:DUF4446 family protein [Parasporobacterium paucivorans]SHI45117.1 Protein of unknown function [Parasporobacterium paucivorans DSM 15970]
MNSKIFDSLGLDALDPAVYIFVLLGLVIILVIITILTLRATNKLKKRYDRFLMGKNAETLEDLIKNRFEELEYLKKENESKTALIQEISEKIRISYQKAAIVKYDAFNEMGGKLSFALALLDENNTGFVLTSMHSREGCYTYIKEIIRGESYIVLGDEEKEAINKAIVNE